MPDMPNWAAWLGWVATLIGWGIAVVQFVYWLMQRAAQEPRNAHLRATRDELRALRAMCTEAIDKGEVIKGDSERQFVRQIAYTLVGIEGHIGAALGGTHAPQLPGQS